MIVDKLKYLKSYEKMHPLFPAAMDFVLDLIAKNVADGKYFCEQDDRIVAIFSTSQTKEAEGVVAEVHRKMIDIQIILDGHEYMDIPTVKSEETVPYREENDVAKFAPVPFDRCHLLNMSSGSFAIFFAGELHAPSMAVDNRSASVRKIVVKVPQEV